MSSQPPTGGAAPTLRPEGSLNVGQSGPSTSAANTNAPAEGNAPKKKKRNKKKRGKAKGDRRQSFAIPGEEEENRPTAAASTPNVNTTQRERPFYKLGHATGGNLSDTSLESEALLDHRDHPPMRTRRDSRVAFPGPDLSQSYRQYGSPGLSPQLSRRPRAPTSSWDVEDDHDRTPLLGSRLEQPSPKNGRAYGGLRAERPGSRGSSRSDRRRPGLSREQSAYDINNPPSVPSTPKLGPDDGLDDVMVTDHLASGMMERRKSAPEEQLIDIDGDALDGPMQGSTPQTPKGESGFPRRHSLANPAEADVCFPGEGMSEIAEEEDYPSEVPAQYRQQRRRRIREWPDISVLEDWSREEKEERSEGIRAKKISEPIIVEGRLRPTKQRWHRDEEILPYRFTYFNEEFQSTIHSQTISELLQPDTHFRDLFIPELPELSDYSSDEEEDASHVTHDSRSVLSPAGGSRVVTRHSSIIGEPNGRSEAGKLTPTVTNATEGRSNEKSNDRSNDKLNEKPNEKPKRYGSQPTFWLNVLSPTETEMRVLSKAFGIHPLTAEDILMQESREKVELFRNYYLVSYRSFNMDSYSDDYLEPVNIYMVVFAKGVLSFHFSPSPHPANVRRRIRQLKDYLILSADWISYAVIDDITDAFAPLMQTVEDQVDTIDDEILLLHTKTDEPSKNFSSQNSIKEKDMEKRSESGETAIESSGELLMRVGQARKKVMLLYRLLGNKADVIKGFAKRCNEQWDVAPRSEIGLYLGDIQDHVLTMSSSLSHYETILSRAHANYLAQLNIKQAVRAEKTNDVLGKLTVLGTIVLPMNIITGMWGMNVLVPGQDIDNLYWFWSITAGLIAFGFSCFFIAKKVYGIV